MDRFFVPPEAIENDRVCIVGEDAAHITRVLRLGAGDKIVVCDGACNEYTACIESAQKEKVELTLIEHQKSITEPHHKVTLYQALPKSGKMETIIQKCVELGIYAVRPMICERCVVRPDGFEKKLARYQRVAYEAAKQSRRGIVPQVLPLLKLEDCDFSAHGLTLFAYEQEDKTTLRTVLKSCSATDDIALIIGPEGGFEADEARAIIARGGISVSLGTRILRSETAGMAMLAMTLYELE
ncbi:16S rRNA (uracil(1498)-N(3))-methyltransferase [Eubacteriales bacterium OttesenSCG-928-K08]|nr:16S rRNA (uracil(1498)-N(3))-methyltransferase [Eubacteriales bacterium OttesenSCG-928-K08]